MTLPFPPPYGLLDAPTFPFPALVALAGRAPLGGPRESALACLLVARLAHALLPPYTLAPDARRARAAATASWLHALPLAPALHAAGNALCDATTAAPHEAVADALGAVLAQAASLLDAPSRAELASLVRSFGGTPPP